MCIRDSIGEYEAAIDAFERVLAMDPWSKEVHYNRGSALLLLGENENAIDAFDRALAIDDGLIHAHNGRGSALRANGEHLAAIKAFDRALVIDPEYKEAERNRTQTAEMVLRDVSPTYTSGLSALGEYVTSMFCCTKTKSV
eukprot:TRINITY_DN16856_c0_g1_i5.p1 TRINITY_DN16856_c0_g1~~TRINITY_DN16856_c0_g1_i5.p1  ORF type:complete len:141 (-),score=20.36 TRINITY_DN16856_c0_g1_i5:327-749(-)